MAYKLLFVVSAIIAAVNSAPAAVFTQSIVQTPDAFARQYLLISPQHQTTYKIQPQLVRPLSQFPRSELIYYYPTYNQPGPPHGANLVNLAGFRDEAPWWQGFWNQITQMPESPPMPAESPMPESPAMPAEMMAMKDDEKKLLKPSADGTFLIDGRRYVLLPGQPQFYGNFDSFQNPSSPLFSLQTLQPLISARSLENGEVPAQPQIEIVDPVEEIPAPPQADVPQTESRSLEGNLEGELRKEDPLMEMKKEEEMMKEEMIELKEMKEEERAERSDDPSIAQAGGTGIAVAGEGGVASSKPQATAVAGKSGLAIASPSATAVSGDFFGSEDLKQEKKE